MNLTDHRNKIYSQFGEEGIVAKLFEIIGEKNRHCVEMGAGDGLHESNTKHFIEQGWRGLMIEGDIGKGAEIRSNTPKATVVLKACQVGDLDTIIRKQDFPEDYDFLSLDVDGDEWHHLRAMQLRPRVICVECNPSIDFRTNFVQQQGGNLGCSTLAMFLLARELGYGCACYDMPNMFLVSGNYIGRRYIDLIAEGEQGRLEVFSNYNSEVYISGFDFWGARRIQLGQPVGHIFEQWPLKKVMAL